MINVYEEIQVKVTHKLYSNIWDNLETVLKENNIKGTYKKTLEDEALWFSASMADILKFYLFLYNLFNKTTFKKHISFLSNILKTFNSKSSKGPKYKKKKKHSELIVTCDLSLEKNVSQNSKDITLEKDKGDSKSTSGNLPSTNYSQDEPNSRYMESYNENMQNRQEVQTHMPDKSNSSLSPGSSKVISKNNDTISKQLLKCTKCLYKTTRKEHLKRHNNSVHLNNIPFECKTCKKAYKYKSSLNLHPCPSQEKEKLFPCKHCQKSFRTKGLLHSHLAIHLNVQSFLCEICGTAFKSQASQKKHVQNIHKKPGNFNCTVCDKKFNTKFILNRHMQRIHKELKESEFSQPSKQLEIVARNEKEPNNK